MDLLSPTHRVIAPDNYGAGKSPEWPSTSRMALQDEVEFLEPVLSLPDEPFTLIGHSYGGAVALRAALANPKRIRALVLYEPTLFAVLDPASISASEANRI
jgi:pimeloyl-ACP methyl ester carboxylesterase